MWIIDRGEGIVCGIMCGGVGEGFVLGMWLCVKGMICVFGRRI